MSSFWGQPQSWPSAYMWERVPKKNNVRNDYSNATFSLLSAEYALIVSESVSETIPLASFALLTATISHSILRVSNETDSPPIVNFALKSAIIDPQFFRSIIETVPLATFALMSAYVDLPVYRTVTESVPLATFSLTHAP